MAVEQLPGQVLEFARYLNGLVDRLDRGGGWCGVFWQRDPDGMRACLEGWEVPPWDVVEALLQDVLAEYGERAAAQETQRARVLHGASLAAYDARPGGRDALGDRLDVMLREQRYAAERQAELNRLLPSAASREEAEAIRLDLAWAQDDHERASARCTELRHRMDDVDRRAPRTRAQGALSFPAPAGGDGAWTRQPENWADPSEGDPSAGDPSSRGGAWRGPEAETPGARSGTHSGVQAGVHDAGVSPDAQDAGAGPMARLPAPGPGTGPGSGPGSRPAVPERTGPWSPPRAARRAARGSPGPRWPTPRGAASARTAKPPCPPRRTTGPRPAPAHPRNNAPSAAPGAAPASPG